MQELDQRDSELLTALQAEIPLVSTPYAFIGQSLDMSEKEVIKRTERLRREGVIRHLGVQFDPRGLGYRSSLVAARVPADRVDEAAAAINTHPGVTQNYLRNNELNLWFTLFVSPLSNLGVDGTIDILGRLAECDDVRPLPTLRLYKSSVGDVDPDAVPKDLAPLTPFEIECVRLLQRELPLQPRPFDSLARATSVSGDELLATARSMKAQGRIRRITATVPPRKGFTATAMGLWVVPEDRVDEYAQQIVRNRAVSHCYLRPVYENWPYNLYTTVHGRSVDECESIINDIAIDTGLTEKRALYPTRELKKARMTFFASDEAEWESGQAEGRVIAAG